MYGNMRVPQRFVVPTDDRRWPEDTRGIKLGRVVKNLRQRKASLAQNQLDALRELGFDWGASQDENWAKHLVALKVYKDIHGHMRVPQCFVIPSDDRRWPSETHGMKLGNFVNNLRRRKTALSQNQMDVLEELGFKWGESLDEKWEKICWR